MIYCGVQLFSDSCHIVAVSDAFALIDQRHFTTRQHAQIMPWLESFKIRSDEPIHWFFDELNLYTYKQTAIIFSNLRDDNLTFMIQHRKLANLMQLFFEWMAQEATFFPAPDQAWLLASAVRLFDDNERRPCYIDDLPF